MNDKTDQTQNALRQTAARLLDEERVNMVVGYGADAAGAVSPAFVRTSDKAAELVWNEQCCHNLTTYLSRDHLKRHFPVAMVVKGCDMRAANMLLKEHVFARKDVVFLGVPCGGVGDPRPAKCGSCTVRTPEGVDELLPGTPPAADGAPEDLFAGVEKLDAMSADERWDFWKPHMERCIRCYACRQVCPMCYCKRCIVEKSQPQWVETSPHVRGNFSWNVIRAFHLAGRCVGCGECERVCPAGIPLGEINAKMAKVMRERYDYVAGMDAETPSPFTTYDLDNDSDEGIL